MKISLRVSPLLLVVLAVSCSWWLIAMSIYKQRNWVEDAPATGILGDGGRKITKKWKLAWRRNMQAQAQDYDYNDDFYRKHEDIPSPGIGH